MQTVSAEWKANQRENFTTESYISLKLGVTDPEASADAEATDNGHEDFSNTEDITKGYAISPTKYATLEQNQWLLDSSFRALPNSAPYGDEGYIGNLLSNSDKEFDVTPTITISFSKVYETIIPGVVITFDETLGEFARKFRVTAKNGSTTVKSVTVENNTSVTYVVETDIQNYDSITVEILEWCLPFRRARISEILLGIAQTYQKSDLMGYTHEMSVSPLSATLPKNEIKFEINNVDGRYNPDNAQGVTKYLVERQMLDARYGYRINGDIEWIKGGTFYLSDWELPQNGITASFTARDGLEYMTDIYSGALTGTLGDIAERAFTQAELPNKTDGTARWTIDSSLYSINAPENPEVGEASIAEILQYCANAACCVMYQDREGVYNIEPLKSGSTDYAIDRFVSYENAESSLSKQLKAVNVNNGQYILNVANAGETQPIDNPLISNARAPIVAQWVADYLTNRKTVYGSFRADPRLDPLDRVTNENQYATSQVLITEIKYNFNGAFRGDYEGRQGV